MITLIAAIGRNREIGYNNQLLWNIPEDMRHFKSYTMGKVLIMGRKTFMSIGGKPLPGRKCIVVSSQPLNGLAITAKSVDHALSIDYCYPEIVVIGGASIYEQTIDLAHKLVITHVDAEFTADTYFPEIDQTKWTASSTRESSTDTMNYRFVEYHRTHSRQSP